MKRAFTVLLILSLSCIVFIILTGAHNQIFGKLLIALCAAMMATSVMKISGSNKKK